MGKSKRTQETPFVKDLAKQAFAVGQQGFKAGKSSVPYHSKETRALTNQLPEGMGWDVPIS